MPSARDAKETVVADIAVTVSDPFPAAVDKVMPPVVNKLLKVPAGRDLPAESSTWITSVAFSPGAYNSTNGFCTGISEVERPGSVIVWQKYCRFGALEKFNWNLFPWSILGLDGFLLSAVIRLFINKKKRHSKVPL